jgi:hypothetical protein
MNEKLLIMKRNFEDRREIHNRRVFNGLGITLGDLETVRMLQGKVTEVIHEEDQNFVRFKESGEERAVEDAVAAGLVGDGVPLVKR